MSEPLMPATDPSHAAAISLRLATPEDAPEVALVAAATFLDTFAESLPGPAIVAHCTRHHTAESYVSYLRDARTRLWLAESPTGAPVGYAMNTVPDLPEVHDLEPDDLELKRIYVLSRFHGGGPSHGSSVGQRLMAAAREDAHERGAQRLLLGVFARNARALRFYVRNGFTQVAARQFVVGGEVCEDFILAART